MEKVSQNCSAQGLDISWFIRLAVSYRPVNSAHSLGVMLRPLSRAWILPPGKERELCAVEILKIKLCFNHLHKDFYTHLRHKAFLTSVSYPPTWELGRTQPGLALQPSLKLWNHDSSSSRCPDQGNSWGGSLRWSCDLYTSENGQMLALQAYSPELILFTRILNHYCVVQLLYTSMYIFFS